MIAGRTPRRRAAWLHASVLGVCVLLAVTLCTTCLVACGSATGVRGLVYVSPPHGLNKPPLPHVKVLVAHTDYGKAIATTHTDVEGRFLVHLSPGVYSLWAEWNNNQSTPGRAKVTSGHVASVELVFPEK